MRDGRRTRGGGPLPLEARRILWQRLWDRLLALPLGESADPTGQPGAVRETEAGAQPTGEEAR